MGEGLRMVGAALCIGAVGVGFVWLGDKLDRAIKDYFDYAEPTENEFGFAGPSSPTDALAAQAMVPEYAAAIRGCNCRTCRNRSAEPCSDFDED